jgi:hypothetical protein
MVWFGSLSWLIQYTILLLHYVTNTCGEVLTRRCDYGLCYAVAEEELLQGGFIAEAGEGPVDDHRRRCLQGHKLRQGLIIFIANLLLYLVRLV